jgi:hypothetical protein
VHALQLRDGPLLVGGFSQIEGSDTRLAILKTSGRVDRSFRSDVYAVDMAWRRSRPMAA